MLEKEEPYVEFIRVVLHLRPPDFSPSVNWNNFYLWKQTKINVLQLSYLFHSHGYFTFSVSVGVGDYAGGNEVLIKLLDSIQEKVNMFNEKYLCKLRTNNARKMENLLKHVINLYIASIFLLLCK